MRFIYILMYHRALSLDLYFLPYILFLLIRSSLSMMKNIISILYADDTQIHISLSGFEALETPTDLNSCVTNVLTWMTNSKLQLNPSKPEFIIIGFKKTKEKFKDLFPLLLLDHDTLPEAFVRNLGFIFDCDFNFKRQISQTCKKCFYHIRDFRRIRNYLRPEAAKSVACAVVTKLPGTCSL